MKKRNILFTLILFMMGLCCIHKTLEAEEVYDGPPYLDSDLKLTSGSVVHPGETITFSGDLVTNPAGCFYGMMLKNNDEYYYFQDYKKYFSGSNQFRITLDENYQQGTYELYSFCLSYGSYTKYYSVNEEEESGHSLTGSFQFVNPSYVEKKNPDVIGLDYQNQTMKKGGTVTCRLNLRTNGRKIQSFTLLFWDGKHEISVGTGFEVISDGIKEYCLSSLAHEKSGSYYLIGIELRDSTNRRYTYKRQDSQWIYTDQWNNDDILSVSGKQYVLQYENPDYDTSFPVISSVSLSEHAVKSPGKIQMTLEGDHLDNIGQIEFKYKKKNGLSEVFSAKGEDIKDQQITMIVPRYVWGGDYYLDSFTIWNKKWIQRVYHRNSVIENQNIPVTEQAEFYSRPDDTIYSFRGALDLTVKGENQVDLIVDGSDPSLLKKISGLTSGKTAVIHYLAYSDYIVPKAVFEAICGKDVTLVLESEGIQWVFYGKDVIKEQCKNINVKTSVFRTSGVPYGCKEDVTEIIFPENGTLPGTATMRIQQDYARYLYHIKQKLYLIYVKNGEKTVIPCDPAMEADEYLSFPIKHNSTYLLAGSIPKSTAGELKKQYILLSETDNSIYATQTKELYLLYDRSKEKILSVTSSNPSVLKAGKDGMIQGIKKGTATVTVKISNGLTASAKVRVLTPSVKLNAKSIPLQIKTTSRALKVSKKISSDSVKKWTSSNKKIVEVDVRTGKLKARKKGTAVIKAYMKSGAVASCKVKVQNTPVRVIRLIFGQEQITVKKGKTATIKITRDPITATGQIYFRIKNTKIASVNTKGVVKGKKRGKTELQIKVGKGGNYPYSIPVIIK